MAYAHWALQNGHLYSFGIISRRVKLPKVLMPP